MNRSLDHGRTIIIIGGGASGVLLAANLVRQAGPGTRILIVEKSDRLGAGLAYSTHNPDHILNVPAIGMSAFPDQPDHFWAWLKNTGAVDPHKPHVFAPRYLYGQYLASLIAGRPDITFVNDGCVGISEVASGVEVRLDNGTSLIGHAAVLAIGHEERQMRGRGLSVRAGSADDTPLDPYAKVMILGSGLSMVDAWLSLAGRNHLGPILVVSRHGLMPRAHAETTPMDLDAADIPFGTSASYFCRWFLETLEAAMARGYDWRAVVDGLRPHNQKIWQSWSERERTRFLTHLRPFWNIHRHRLPPDLHDMLTRASRTGQLTIIAGTFLAVEQEGDQLVATVRRRGLNDPETFEVTRLYDCGGVAVNVEESSNPVINQIVKSGLGRPDTLKIGLDVTREGALIGGDGKPSKRLLALGPLTRSVFFEIESVPEIRTQAQAMARKLLGSVDVGYPDRSGGSVDG